MADVADTLAEWSSTTASNAPSGATTIGTGLDDNLRELQGVVVRGLSHKGSDIASTGTMDIGAVEGLMHDITGTTTVTGLGTVRAGIWKLLKYEGAVPVIHNATSLILLGGANRTMASGDTQVVISEGSGNWRELAYFAAARLPGLILQAEQATTSGTAVDATVSSSTVRWALMGHAVSTNGTNEFMVQLGDSGGIETSGYVGSYLSASGSTAVDSDGFNLSGALTAAVAYDFVVEGYLQDATNNVWLVKWTQSAQSAGGTITGCGSKALTGPLTTVRLTTDGGSDAFDAGAISILVE